MSTTNSYAVAAKKKSFMELAAKLETKGSVKNTAIETTKDVIAGVLIGGFAGAFIGKPSLLVGLAVTAAGHYFGSSLVSSCGIGMMTSGGYSAINGISGTDGLNGGKERVKEFASHLTQRLYLDKLKSKTKAPAASEETNGLGNVQYFKYPNPNGDQLDMSGLDNIEREIIQSGEQYERRQQFAGNDEDVSGAEENLY